MSQRAKPGLFDLEITARCRIELHRHGKIVKFEAADGSLLAHLVADLAAIWEGDSTGSTATARIYGGDGHGARDPRTEATVPRYKDALRGRLERLLEAWRRRRSVSA